MTTVEYEEDELLELELAEISKELYNLLYDKQPDQNTKKTNAEADLPATK